MQRRTTSRYTDRMSDASRGISRRRFLALGGGALAGAGLIACDGFSDSPGATGTAPAPPNSATPPALPTSTAGPPTPVPTPVPTAPPAPLASMIGQMLLVGFRGLAVPEDDPLAQAIASGRLGNVVLFESDGAGGLRNVESPAQVAALDASLQSYAPSPMLIAADEEGGKVARLDPRHGFPETVSEEYLGNRDDTALTAQYAGSMATVLSQAGINLNLAPVVDLNVNPANPVIGSLGRSFSADPDVVTRQALAFIDAHHAQGVLCTLKHFPGHGSSTADSHLGFVDVTGTWSRTELEPFRRIIAAGKADAIMTAHIFNATLDPDYPATLSRATIEGVLRGELGYDGVVLTDDMQMGAISQYYGFDQAIERAINAGADIISIANTTVYQTAANERAFAAIDGAVAAGRIPASRIEQSYARIMRLKQRLSA
jgi:beta-N-acetylhexosaminidase